MYSLTNDEEKKHLFFLLYRSMQCSFPSLQPRCAVRHCSITIRSDTECGRWLQDPNLIRSGLFHLGGLWALERAKDRPRGGLPVPSCDWSLKPQLTEESLSAERQRRVPLEVQTDERWITCGKWKLCLGEEKRECRGWGAMCLTRVGRHERS